MEREWSQPWDGLMIELYGGSYKSLGGSSPFGGATNFNPAHMWETNILGSSLTRSLKSDSAAFVTNNL